MENQVLTQLVLDGRVDFFLSGTTNNPLPGSGYETRSIGNLYSMGIQFAPCNGIFNSPLNLTNEQIEEGLSFFKKRDLPFIWWSKDDNLAKHHFQFGGTLTGIALDISHLQPQFEPASIDLKVVQVSTLEEAALFAQTAAKTYPLTPNATKEFVTINQAAMKSGRQIHFLAYFEGKSVGTATLSSDETSSGIWNLTTIPEFRKKGVGRALVSTALVEAKERGHQGVMAILMPKGMAWNLFERLGFKEVIEFPFYVYGANASELE
jgi:ribosomal protein S18 acetylase RimI-like enzyme